MGCVNISFFRIRNDSRIATIKCRIDGTLLTLDEVSGFNKVHSIRAVLQSCTAAKPEKF